MKKNILALFFSSLIALLTTGCFSDSSAYDSNESETKIQQNISVETTSPIATVNPESAMDAWQEAYVVFLRNLPELSDNCIQNFSVWDLNSNGVPELLIVQMDKDALNAVLTVYSYDGNVYLVGDYSNPKGSFLGGFVFSSNSMFPGLFEVWWGGGMEHFSYLTVTEKKLKSEYVLYIDRTGESPQQYEVSIDKQLINELIDVYHLPYVYTDNLLEWYPINNDNITAIIWEWKI